MGDAKRKSLFKTAIIPKRIKNHVMILKDMSVLNPMSLIWLFKRTSSFISSMSHKSILLVCMSFMKRGVDLNFYIVSYEKLKTYLKFANIIERKKGRMLKNSLKIRK